ncbi:cation diffusion facilitator family transporter [Salinisphaera sp. PC39]|uniref:cation transporter dimerization domain-containing protein n=1 Tax=Salinisphaera sp. PC39 TaxID=1304156 RepID=UPI0033420CDC
MAALDGVKNAHHVHAWALTSGRYVFSGHLRIAEDADTQAVLKAAHGMLKDRFGFFFATLQVESTCLDESGAEAIDITRAPPGEGQA